jgi:uncharacterized membrane protein YbhN (UPF0104 family)
VSRCPSLVRSFWITAKLCIVAAILALISRLDIISVATIAWIYSHPIAAAVVLLAVVAALHLNVLRWYWLLLIPGQSISFRRLWSITFASYFVGSTTLGASAPTR